jgi:hypothetical protein
MLRDRQRRSSNFLVVTKTDFAVNVTTGVIVTELRRLNEHEIIVYQQVALWLFRDYTEVPSARAPDCGK